MLHLRDHYTGQVIYREYSPAHFYSDSYLMEFSEKRSEESHHERHCAYIEEVFANNTIEHYRTQNPRVLAVNDIMKKYGIPVLPTFDVSLKRPDLHSSWWYTPFSIDCRHWMSPSNLLDLWVDLLFNALIPPV